MKYVDPSMDCDLYADKPWALVSGGPENPHGHVGDVADY